MVFRLKQICLKFTKILEVLLKLLKGANSYISKHPASAREPETLYQDKKISSLFFLVSSHLPFSVLASIPGFSKIIKGIKTYPHKKIEFN